MKEKEHENQKSGEKIKESKREMKERRESEAKTMERWQEKKKEDVERRRKVEMEKV